jgi:hypothetical protein
VPSRVPIPATCTCNGAGCGPCARLRAVVISVRILLTSNLEWATLETWTRH